VTERAQVLFLQIVGTLVAFGVVAMSCILAAHYPVPATLVAALVSGLMAKLFGQPIGMVAVQQAGELPPQLAAMVARRAIDSLPPKQVSPELHAASVVLLGLSQPPPPAEDPEQ
jgi:hypothetical protein